MKKKITVTNSQNTHTETREYSVPAKDHLSAQQHYPHRIHKPKKGMGSYKRHERYGNIPPLEDDEVEEDTVNDEID